ncbi:putative ribonuclease H-like domain-containing protein, partial [Tanacetum coccineum]
MCNYTHTKEPKNISQALQDESWVEAMQEELLQFKLQKVWILVDLPSGKKAIGTKWVFKNKKDERSIVVKTDFHEIIDFLTRSSIHYALNVSPVISTTFVEQFWMSAKFKTINNVRYITAKVAGKPVNISEASIRTDLLFDDGDGIDSLHNQAIFDAIQLMGYEGDLTVLT